MKGRGLAALAVVLAGCDASAPPAGPCRGEEVLARAAEAYNDTPALTDTARYEIRVPGAAPKQEVVEFGFGRDLDAWLRMPGLYVTHATKDELVTRIDAAGPGDAYLITPRTGDLQAATDTAFEGRGSPLVPAPLLLREAGTPEARVQAFRSKLLAPLRIVGCMRATQGGSTLHEVELAAENGRVRARFDAGSGLLQRLELDIVPEPDAESIRAEARFEPRPGAAPPPLPRLQSSDTRVARLGELSGADAGFRANSFSHVKLADLDGAPVSLANLKGKVVIVEFWARWCAPCRVTLPAIEKFSRSAARRKLPVRVLLVNTQDEFASPDEARAEIRRYLAWAKIGLPSLIDPGSAMHERSGGGLPLTLVIGPDGEFVETHAGFEPDLEKRLEKRIDELLARG